MHGKPSRSRAGETDAPVTTDIHRLTSGFRDSLHGGTGFRVVPLARDEITHFDPFRDALLAESSGSNTAVRFLEEARYPFPGGTVHSVPGGTDELLRRWRFFWSCGGRRSFELHRDDQAPDLLDRPFDLVARLQLSRFVPEFEAGHPTEATERKNVPGLEGRSLSTSARGSAGIPKDVVGGVAALTARCRRP